MSEKWVVGITKTAKVLSEFDSEEEATEFISSLKDHEQGIYFLDPPSYEDINCIEVKGFGYTINMSFGVWVSEYADDEDSEGAIELGNLLLSGKIIDEGGDNYYVESKCINHRALKAQMEEY